MSGFKFLLTLVFSFQLSTGILAQSNLTDEAQKALDLLHGQIEDAAAVVSIEAVDLWDSYVSDISIVFNDYLGNDTTNFRLLIINVTAYANSVTNGSQCIQLLLNSSGFVSNVFSTEELIAANLFDSAKVDVLNIVDYYTELNTEFIRNCVQNKINCDGTSRAVIAEVGRLLPKVKRIPFELLTELHILGYKLSIDLEDAHTELMQIYNKAIQNATLCVVSKIKEQRQQTELPEASSESIIDLYFDLVIAVEDATATSVIDVLSHEDDILRQSLADQQSAIKEITIAASRVGDAILSLSRTARYYNVTLNCTVFDIGSIINSAFERLDSEFHLLEGEILVREFERGMRDINSTATELHSISLEYADCLSKDSCDSFKKKVISKQSEIPLHIQQVANSTVLLLLQTVTAVRESGARIVRDTEERAEMGLIDLKSCIQSSFK